LGEDLFQHAAGNAVIGGGLSSGGEPFAGGEYTLQHRGSQHAVEVAAPQTTSGNWRQQRTLRLAHDSSF
jgi:hypothetical protein